MRLEHGITLSRLSHSRASTLSNSIKKNIVHNQKYLGFSVVTNVPSLPPACWSTISFISKPNYWAVHMSLTYYKLKIKQWIVLKGGWNLFYLSSLLLLSNKGQEKTNEIINNFLQCHFWTFFCPSVIPLWPSACCCLHAGNSNSIPSTETWLTLLDPHKHTHTHRS